MKSQQYKLNKNDYSDVLRNMRRFVAPLGLLYVAQIIGVISIDGHVIRLADLVPNQMTIGGVALYILNAMNDLFNKWKSE